MGRQDTIDRKLNRRELVGATGNNRRQALQTRNGTSQPESSVKSMAQLKREAAALRRAPRYDKMNGRYLARREKVNGITYDVLIRGKEWGIRNPDNWIVWFRDFEAMDHYWARVVAFAKRPKPKHQPRQKRTVVPYHKIDTKAAKAQQAKDRGFAWAHL
jgi:hypothetical protein